MKGGWKRVRFAAVMPLCDCCGEEAFCKKHRMHFADCSCIGPTEDGVKYKTVDGVLYGKRKTKGNNK